jgi:peptide/nickel transport system substrate-binding protein
MKSAKAAVLLLALGLAIPAAQAQKYGGILKSMQRENPNSLSILDESGSFVTAWPMGGVYNNVVYFDPLKPVERFDTVIPELASGWSWNGDNTQLVLTLNPGARWHDGTPFTAKDVKYTFDVVRDASPTKLRINPRKLWWFNVKDVTIRGDREVTFHLLRPQPSLLLMLACGLTPVYPAHFPLAQLRTETMGTGPFKLAEYTRDAVLKVRKNPDYFVKGRPYLDGIDYIIIKNKATRTAALQSGQVDVGQPTETEQTVYESLKAVPGMEFNRTPNTTNVNMLLNHERPPFDNVKLRRAFNLAVDRYAYARSIEPGAAVGTHVLSRPQGAWGLEDSELRTLPGYGDPAAEREEARRLMRELGYGPNNLLKVKITTQAVAYMRDASTWIAGELKQIYVSGEVEVVEVGNFFPRMARKEYALSVQATGNPIDDPDATYYESFLCGGTRNYQNYCNKAVEKLFDEQSTTMDYEQRVALVGAIERRLTDEVARISIGFRTNYNARRNFVKNFLGHNTASNWARMQDVWLDK